MSPELTPEAAKQIAETMKPYLPPAPQQETIPAAEPVETPAHKILLESHEALKESHEALKEQHELVVKDHDVLCEVVRQAAQDSKAFINQCDREGIGMQTVVDHRTRVEKFIAQLKKIGRAL